MKKGKLFLDTTKENQSIRILKISATLMKHAATKGDVVTPMGADVFPRPRSLIFTVPNSSCRNVALSILAKRANNSRGRPFRQSQYHFRGEPSVGDKPHDIAPKGSFVTISYADASYHILNCSDQVISFIASSMRNFPAGLLFLLARTQRSESNRKRSGEHSIRILQRFDTNHKLALPKHSRLYCIYALSIALDVHGTREASGLPIPSDRVCDCGLIGRTHARDHMTHQLCNRRSQEFWKQRFGRKNFFFRKGYGR